MRKAAEPVVIEGLPASIEPTISRIDLRVQVDEAYTLGNAFKVMGNNVYCYLLMVITGLSYLTILVLIALIINSLRKSIRDEQPLRHSRRRTALVPSFFIRDQLFYRKTINIICFSKINTNFALSKLKNEQACRTKKDCTGIYC